MGAVLRRYWLPLVESGSLGPPDGPPQRIRLLGEDLIAFRDTAGRPGLLAEACPHRRASLFFGRNEENGIRCVYHGWKYGVDGSCLETPTEPLGSTLRERIRAVSYRCVERNGIVWAWLGPERTEPPALPGLGWAGASPDKRSILTYQRGCNWVQALEGDLDTAHLGWLHSRFEEGERIVAFHEGDRLRDVATRDTRPTLEVVDTSAGVCIGARRDYDADSDYWRITQYLMPIFTSVPAIGPERRGKAWVPLDDEHTLVWEMTWRSNGPQPPSAETDGSPVARVPSSGFLPEDSDPLSRRRFAARRENDYGIDRDRQRQRNFTGVEESAPLQDALVQESMGPIVDRSLEHLGASDSGIIRVRQRLLEAARRLATEGIAPPGAEAPGAYRLRGCQLLLPRNADWRALSRAEQEA